jgi:uncharacterized membrane protein SirB2
MYLALKHLHMTLALLTFISFFIRGIWMWRSSPLLHKRLVKILPHIIDTLLLISAFVLAFHLRLTPGENPWLMAKIVALVIYIGLGVVAFRHSQTNARKLAWLAALAVFAYIVTVAITKNPLIF